MNEEENQAIEKLKSIVKVNNDFLKGVENQTINQEEIKSIEIALKLIEKQQKEMEELKERVQEFLDNGNYTWKQKYEETFEYVKDNFINKDKIRKKIDLIDKEYAEFIEKNKNDLYLVNINAQRHSAMQLVLEELLGE